MKNYVIPVIVPNTGKKKDWIFDNQKTHVTSEELTKETLEEIIKKHLEKIEDSSEHFFVEVAFTGADFTNLSEQVQKELLEVVQKYIR